MSEKKRLALLFFVLLGGSMLACRAVTGVPEAALPTSEPATAVPPQESQTENCFTEETYHPDAGICYRDDGSATPLFVTYMAGVTENDNFTEDLLDDEYNLIRYHVNGNEIEAPTELYTDTDERLQGYLDDTATQHMIWRYYAGMIPAESRAMLTDYVVMTDGTGGTLAAVEQSPDDPQRWTLNVDIADAVDVRDLTLTLLHEYGHLLTLNADQVDINEDIFNNPDDEQAYDAAEASCPTYFPGEGCATETSYLYQFYQTFWADIYAEWLDIQYLDDDDAYYTALDDFYFKYEDRFVSDYAVTNPEEDIAESWTFFLISDKPAGDTIAEQKILFFYQYPELVALREQIVARTYSRLVRMSP